MGCYCLIDLICSSFPRILLHCYCLCPFHHHQISVFINILNIFRIYRNKIILRSLKHLSYKTTIPTESLWPMPMRESLTWGRPFDSDPCLQLIIKTPVNNLISSFSRVCSAFSKTNTPLAHYR